jgi:TonB family protein
MPNQNLARFRFKHDLLIMAVVLTFASVQQVRAQAKNEPPKQGAPKSAQVDAKCQPKSTSTTLAKPPDHWRVGRGERYLRSPRVSLSVDENGAVVEAKITRTSGIKEIDVWVLDSVKAWKYNAAPGCGVRDVGASVSINFSAGEANGQ